MSIMKSKRQSASLRNAAFFPHFLVKIALLHIVWARERMDSRETEEKLYGGGKSPSQAGLADGTASHQVECFRYISAVVGDILKSEGKKNEERGHDYLGRSLVAPATGDRFCSPRSVGWRGGCHAQRLPQRRLSNALPATKNGKQVLHR